MKILFHCWEYPPNGGGVGAYIQNMARALGSEGHEAVVVTGRAPGQPEEQKTAFGVVYRLYDRAEIGSPRVADLVRQTAERHGVQAIEGADHLGECAPLLRAPHRIPVVIKAHTSQALRVGVQSHVFYAWQRLTIAAARLKIRGQICNERCCLERADLLLYPTRRIMAELRRQGLRVPSRTAFVPNPVLPGEPPDRTREAPSPRLLFVGRIEIGKGIEFLPGILRGALRSCPEARLAVAGPDSYARGIGSCKAWLQKRLGSSADRVDFLGNQKPEELDAAYQASWVLIVPSRWDNFPTVVLEAMARGLPVVASDRGGMAEMLEGTGCPIEDPASPAFGDAAAALLRNPAARRELGEKARERAARCYGPAPVARAYAAALG